MVKPRPALRWHGGKWLLAPWIISHFPPHRTYVEPFGGAASTLLRKPPAYAEIYNDLDDDVVNFFTVLRDPDQALALIAALKLTPFARTEFFNAYYPAATALERARALAIRSFMGFGSDGHNGARPTGFRANSNRSGTTPARDWVNYPDALAVTVERLRGVIIEHRDARLVMAAHDGHDTLHYVDPPYVHETRSASKSSARKNYTHEMSGADHAELLDHLDRLNGAVVLSGYRCPLYDDRLTHWTRRDRKTLADGAKARIESLWLNPRASRSAGGLFNR